MTEVLVDTRRAKIWDDERVVNLRDFTNEPWLDELVRKYGENGTIMSGQNARIYLGWAGDNDPGNENLRRLGHQAIQRHEDLVVLDPSIIEYVREPERKFQDVGHVGEHWGRAGSGFLFMFGSRALLLKRAGWVMEGGTWGIPGGAIPHDQHGRPMAALESAKRETREEIGVLPRHRMISRFVFRQASGAKAVFTFTTFVAEVSAMFEPKLNNESDDYVWISLEDALERLPLHPGVRALIENRGDWSR